MTNEFIIYSRLNSLFLTLLFLETIGHILVG